MALLTPPPRESFGQRRGEVDIRRNEVKGRIAPFILHRISPLKLIVKKSKLLVEIAYPPYPAEGRKGFKWE